MEQLNGWFEYFRDNPMAALIAGVVVLVILYFLFRKPKTVREADRRLRELRDERGGYYDHFRHPH